jgi:hypothetical protein
VALRELLGLRPRPVGGQSPPPPAQGERERGLRWRGLFALALSLLTACGYRAVTAYRAKGGVERIHVRAFENDSAEPELGAALTAALRDELARRGAAAEDGAPAQLDGSVRVTSATPSSWFTAGAAVAVEIHARLTVDGKVVHQLVLRPTEPHSVGADALESEGRKAAALRRLARDAAREILAGLEQD